MNKLPSKAKYVIIGAGIHGLSTAWNLGEKIRAKVLEVISEEQRLGGSLSKTKRQG